LLCFYSKQINRLSQLRLEWLAKVKAKSKGLIHGGDSISLCLARQL
jgi:hypothetical protein